MNMQSIATCKYSAALNRCLPRPMNHARRQRPLHQHPMGESVALLRLAPAPMAAPRSVGGDEAMPMMDRNTTPPINVMLVLAQVAALPDQPEVHLRPNKLVSYKVVAMRSEERRVGKECCR